MDFAFPDSVPAIESVPEQFRSLYAQPKAGDPFGLQKDNPIAKGAIEAVSGLSKALRAARADVDTAKKGRLDITPLREWGEDPTVIATTVQAKIKELQDQVAAGSKGKLDLDALRKDLTTAHQTALADVQARNKGLQSQLFSVLVESNAKSAIAANKGDIDLLMPFVKDQVQMVEEDGQIKVYVINPTDKSKRYGAAGADMTIAELITEMKGGAKFSKLFESTAPKGGGTPPGGPSGRQGGQQNKADRTPNQMIADGLSKGQYSGGAGRKTAVRDPR